jgi:hypothetical protein
LTRNNFICGATLFLVIYLLLFVAQTIFLTDLRLATIPVLKTLLNPKRLVVFLFFVPFYFVYFFVKGIYLHKLEGKFSSEILDLVRTASISVVPCLVLIFLNYILMILFGIRLFPEFLGFIIEFILDMVPLFTITLLFTVGGYIEKLTISELE